MVSNKKGKPVFIEWKWNHIVFFRATILSFPPVYIYIYIYDIRVRSRRVRPILFNEVIHWPFVGTHNSSGQDRVGWPVLDRVTEVVKWFATFFFGLYFAWKSIEETNSYLAAVYVKPWTYMIVPRQFLKFYLSQTNNSLYFIWEMWEGCSWASVALR